MISKEQVESYEERGYVVINYVLSPQLLQELRQVTDDVVASASEISQANE